MDLSIELDTLVTESLMLGLSGDFMISTVLSLKLRHFLTRFDIFFVQVALNANTLALGNRDRNSPTWLNHFRNASLPSSFSPLFK
jgi:hypothetical protein